MDSLIKRFDGQPDRDLVLCAHRGIAYQRNMARGRIQYDEKYFQNFKSYAGSSTERALNAGRCAMLRRHAPIGATVLDIGIGSGAFLLEARRAGFEAKGSDINPVALEWLETEGLHASSPRDFDVVTFWDSLEHIEIPDALLRRIKKNAIVLVAIPVFDDLRRIRESKHYKPGEHLYYFTADGFVDWMAMRGFRCLEHSAHEIEAGRESIGAFAFRRDLPDYDDFIAAYSEMHSTRHYGDSATELHLGRISFVVRQFAPRSILDYGCGRSDLVAHFWNDGARRIARYDPGIPRWRKMPEGHFDLALVCDVMEHIPIAGVDRVLAEVRSKCDRAVFTISTKLARARLPDGTNAHVTILTKSEWENWVASYFGSCKRMPSDIDGELVLLAGDIKAQRLAA